MRGLVFDLVDADGILENHATGALEIKETGAGGGVAAGTKHDRRALLRQVVVGAQDVVIALDLVIDMLDAWPGQVP